MPEPALVPSLSHPAKSRILFIVADGLGGLPHEPSGPTEIEAAATPAENPGSPDARGDPS